MFRLSIRNLFAKKLRLATTALAIVLGVAFTVGTMILTDTMMRSIDAAIADVNDGVDVVVRGVEVGEDEVFTLSIGAGRDLIDFHEIDGPARAKPFFDQLSDLRLIV